jgi:ubiquinone/menaquinone biosynthesis C-methylase UbiE
VAADYDQAGFLHQISRGLVTRAGVGNGAPVLELGCGTGAAQAEAARRVDPDGPVVGIDLAEPMAAEAAELESDPLESVVRFWAAHCSVPRRFDFVNTYPNGVCRGSRSGVERRPVTGPLAGRP